MPPELERLQPVPLREAWPHEARDFSAWLSENLDALSEKLDFELTLVEKDKVVGSFVIDVLAEDEAGDYVVIENQLEKTDHDHLGKVITYMSSLDAKTGIWVTSEPRDEHRRAIDWLNKLSPIDYRFYLVRVETVKIGSSQPAPLFTVEAQPDPETKKRSKDIEDLAERHVLRRDFWTKLLAKAREKTNLHANISPSKQSWISTGGGRAGLSFNYTITRKNGGVELYIDKGKESDEINKRWFDFIFSHKAEIEQAFGDPLEWERLNERRASRIAKRYATGNLYDEATWAGVQDKMIDAMIRLEKVLRPYLKQLPS